MSFYIESIDKRSAWAEEAGLIGSKIEIKGELYSSYGGGFFACFDVLASTCKKDHRIHSGGLKLVWEDY